MARLPEADEKDSALLTQVYAHIKKTRGQVSNSLRCFSHSPEGLQRFAALGEYVRFGTKLPSRDQEMVTLAITRDNHYAWLHHQPSAIKAGITQQELNALHEGNIPDSLSASERSALLYAQEFYNHGHVSDKTFNELKAHYSERDITDLTLIASFFLAFGATINALGVELEPSYKQKAS